MLQFNYHSLLLFLVLLFATNAEAQRFGGDPKERARQNADRVSAAVQDLSEQQKSAILALYEKYAQKQQELFQELAGNRQELTQAFRELREAQNKELAALLSPDQVEQLQAELQNQRGNFNRQRPESSGPAVPTGLVRGYIVDEADSAYILSVNVILKKSADSSIVKIQVTGRDGKFEFSRVSPGRYFLEQSHVAFAGEPRSFVVRRQGVDLGAIGMKVKQIVLDEVVKEGKAPPVTQRGDTVQYNAAAYKTLPDASAEDLVTKMPGITVENGTVTAQGEDVKRVLVDGREFFGDDPNIALKNLPAEVIEKIEVFDRLSDQSQFTGIDDGNTEKTINIVTRQDKRNGQFGKLSAGIGTDNRYTAGGNVNLFKNDTRVSVIGLSNNINQQNFATEDLMGVVSSASNRSRRGAGGQRGGRPGGGGSFSGRAGAGNVNDFLVGSQNGITTTHSFGINFNDIWGEKLTVTGSYFFNKSNNTNLQMLGRQYLFENDLTQFYDETNQNDADNFNHRLNMRLIYTLDKRNSIIFTPRLSFQSYDGLNSLFGRTYVDSSSFLNRTLNNYSNLNDGYNGGGNLLWRHRFEKQRRTLSVNVNTNVNSRTGTNELQAINEFNDRVYTVDSLDQVSEIPGGGYTIGGNLRYTEPIGEKSILQVNYRVSYRDSYSDQKTWNFNESLAAYSELDTALSNEFQNGYLTNTAGFNYRLGNRQKMLMLGMDYQIADLKSEQFFPIQADLDKRFTDFLPSIMLRRQFTRSKTLNVFYRTSTNAPSIAQLQNVLDNSNPLLLSVGNPRLEQEYTHQIVSRYSATSMEKMSSFFLFFTLRNTQNKVNTATSVTLRDTTIANVPVPSGVQVSSPVNVDGYWNARTFATYGFPVKVIKSNLNLNGGFNYTRSPGISNQVVNLSNTFAFNQSTVVASNISERVDFSLSYNAVYNIVRNGIQPNLNSDYISLNSVLKLNWLIWKGIVLRSQLVYQRYDGLSESFNQKYTLWNASLGKKIFRNQLGEIQLSVFDLLGQNTNITRNVTETYIEDVQSEMISQYFMLSFIYNLRRFQKAQD